MPIKNSTIFGRLFLIGEVIIVGLAAIIIAHYVVDFLHNPSRIPQTPPPCVREEPISQDLQMKVSRQEAEFDKLQSDLDQLERQLKRARVEDLLERGRRLFKKERPVGDRAHKPEDSDR